MMLSIVAFVGLGTFLIYRSFAATVAGSLEGEAMTLPTTGGAIVADSTAINGQALKLTSLGAASGTLTTTLPGINVTLRAKGTQCQGAPQAKITVDGADAVLASVSATSWTTYSVAVVSNAGTHAVTAALSNPYVKAGKSKTACTRELYVDQIQIIGNDPTPTPSGTPTPDTIAPQAALTSPIDGATVSGTVNISANASDNVGVTKVEFLVNGNVASTVTATPYAYTWDTTAVSNSIYKLSVKAYDAAGNVGTNPSIAVTVNNAAPPVATGPAGNWTKVFGDEFNGTALDTTKWSPNWYGEGGTMNKVGTYAANVSESNGNLNLTLASSTSGALVHTNYATGRYQLPIGGYVEASVYFPGSTSSNCSNWPAWWASGPSWPAAGEHDIAEVLRGQLTVNYHSSSGPHNQGAVAGTWCGAYHTYGLQRLASSANVYWDGVLVKSYATDDNGTGEELILNVGNGGVNQVYGTASQVKVDWVRA